MMRAACFALIALAGSTACAMPTAGFVETFNTGNGDWNDPAGPLTWIGAGGPDGSGFVSTTVADLSAVDPTNGALLFRGESALGSSAGAVSGDYNAGNITAISVDVRILGGAPASFYARIAPAFGGGAVFVEFAPVTPGTWQTVTFELSESNPGYILEGVPTPGALAGVLADVQKLQFGAIPVPGATGPATFQLDNVRLIPAPASAALLGLGGLVAVRRRR